MKYLFLPLVASVATATSLAAAPATPPANILALPAATVSVSMPKAAAEDLSVFKRKKRKVSPAYRRTARRR